VELSARKRKLSSVQIIASYYALTMITAAILLWLPIMHNPGVEVSFIDAFFTAVSAVSVTGLTVVDTAGTFNLAGKTVLIVLFQIGGVGIMVLGTFMWIILGRAIGLEQRRWIMVDQNQSTLAGLVALMLSVLRIALIIEAVGAILLSVYFIYRGYYTNWPDALYHAIFASVSAFTNAGFDITGESLQPFANDYVIVIINIFLIILGGIGFPVLIEISEFLATVHLQKKFRFSLFTKVTTATYFGLLIVGIIGFWLLERNHYLVDKSWHQALVYSLFNSVTSRSAGLSTMDMAMTTEPTQIFISMLMFIGASPSSVGGGIRTTTFIVVLLAIKAYMRGRQEIRIFRRELHPDDVQKALMVFIFAIIIVILSIFVIFAHEPFPLTAIIYDVSSAFGTCGSSVGITSELSVLSKSILMLLMFIGRIGIIPFLLLLKKDERKSGYHYLKERIIVG